MTKPWHSVYDDYGISHSLDYPDEPLHHLLREAAGEYPEMGLVQDGDETTYEETWDAARSLAGALHERGVGRGNAVVSLLPTSVEFIVTSYAASVAGATNVPVSPLESTETLVENLSKLEPEAIVSRISTPTSPPNLRGLSAPARSCRSVAPSATASGTPSTPPNPSTRATPNRPKTFTRSCSPAVRRVRPRAVP